MINPHAIRHGIRGIVLDAVGTLIEARPSVWQAYRAAALRQGVDLSEAEVRSRFLERFRWDEERERAGDKQTDEAREVDRWSKIVRDVLPEAPNRDLAFRELWHHFGMPDAWTVFTDAPEALRWLDQAGIEVRIGSNFDGRLRSVLGGLPELSHLAASAVISSEVGYRKPHPAFYEAARSSLSVRPEEVLFVGDDWENDVEGARCCGMNAVHLDRKGRNGAEQRLTAIDSGERIGDLRALALMIPRENEC